MMSPIYKILCSVLLLVYALHSEAATWVKLKDNTYSRLMLDRQSVLTHESYTKAWVKIEYKTPQKNPDSVDKEYTLSKALWYFDCAVQKTATTQVFQYLHQELVYSAAVDLKNAEFTEPQPDSDVEIAMRYVCKSASSHAAANVARQPPVSTLGLDPKKETMTNLAPPAAGNAAATPMKTAPKADNELPKNDSSKKAEKPVAAEKADVSKTAPAKATAEWSYEGKTGPDQWGKLDAQFNTCSTGLNQSPAPLDSTIHAALKPIRSIQKFTAKDIQRLPHGMRVNFKEGNMMVLDKSAFQLKYMDVHTPSEHQINGQSYPLELQFLHVDNKKNVAMMSVLFKAGDPSEAMEKLLVQLPKTAGEIALLKARLTPSDWMPTNPQYYRYSGSLTTPPCTEGVRWIIMKSPRQASSEQLKAFADAIGKPNHRPTQALNGRTVLE